jgi:hypothetical protein
VYHSSQESSGGDDVLFTFNKLALFCLNTLYDLFSIVDLKIFYTEIRKTYLKAFIVKFLVHFNSSNMFSLYKSLSIC